METCSHCKEQWFQIGLAIKGDNINIYKACIKDTDSLKDLALPFLFGESNELNLRLVLNFLPILITVNNRLTNLPENGFIGSVTPYQ